MGLFAWMLTGHLAGDFLLQTNWMAYKKAENTAALLAHCAVYTAVISALALFAGGLSLYAILLLFASHALLDRRRFVRWWCKHILGSEDIPWLAIVADQTWHIAFLAAACALSGG